MKQKIIWKVFLLIGINILLYSCDEQTDYKLDVDVIYKNETNHFIQYFTFNSEHNKKILLFELKPKSEKKFELRGESGKEIDFENSKIILHNIHKGSYQIFISYDDKCLMYNYGEGSTVESNYDIKKIKTRYYELVYTFTDEEYNKAVLCE